MSETTRHLETELSDYVDGALTGDARSRVEQHLSACESCTALLAELREVASTAAALADVPPDTDLWSGIEARIGSRRVIPIERGGSFGKRFSVSIPQLAAASLFVAALSGGAVWWALRSSAPVPGRSTSAGPLATVTPQGSPAPALASGATPSGSAPVVTAPSTGGVSAGTTVEPAPVAASGAYASFDAGRYDAAVAELQHVLAQNRGRLDPQTVRMVEANLEVIDAAIIQARRALVADPSNSYLNGHLADQMRRKVRLLQRATDAVAANAAAGGS